MSKNNVTEPELPPTVVVTLPDGKKWDRNNEPAAEFSRADAALWILVHSATSVSS